MSDDQAKAVSWALRRLRQGIHTLSLPFDEQRRVVLQELGGIGYLSHDLMHEVFRSIEILEEFGALGLIRQDGLGGVVGVRNEVVRLASDTTEAHEEAVRVSLQWERLRQRAKAVVADNAVPTIDESGVAEAMGWN